MSATGINTNILTFFNLDPKSAGKYRCVVNNHHGRKATDYAIISITGKLNILHYVEHGNCILVDWVIGLGYVIAKHL